MYTEENYFWGMVAYLMGVLLVTPALFKVTAWIMPWKPLRILMRLFVLTLLLTPTKAYQDTEFYAPAWTVLLFESIKPNSEEGAATALALMVSTFAGLGLLVAAFYLGMFFWRRQRAKSKVSSLESYSSTVEEPAAEPVQN